MGKKVLKSIRDLKEGMKVFIKHNLVGGMKYGGLHWVNHMISGEMEVVSIRLVKDGDKYPLHDSISAGGFFYTNEMIDWDKTNELNYPSKSNKAEKGKVEMTKEEFFKKYKGEDISVLCDTKEKSDEFLKLAEMFGIMWNSGRKPTELNRFQEEYGVYYTIWDDNKLTRGNNLNRPVVKFEILKTQPKQSNFVNLPQIKTVNSVTDDHSLCGTFIQIGEETISYVEGNSVGTAHCHPDDEFNLEVGKALAYYRWTKGE